MVFLPPIPLIKRNWTGTTTDGLVKDKEAGTKDKKHHFLTGEKWCFFDN
mgnify:CR=1 FL=1